MTFEQYITNPMGKNNAILSSTTRESIRKDYTNRFNRLLLRENGKIDYTLYRNDSNNTYFIHIKIPSETVENFYYDVVIKFSANASIKDNGRDLRYYNIQFYSNDPAFVFTYAHTFIKNGLFVKELLPKMSKEAVKTKAKEKNPQDINGYVKSIYFAYLYMQQRGLFNKIQYLTAKPFNLKELLSSVEDADTKIEDRQVKGKVKNKKKKEEITNVKVLPNGNIKYTKNVKYSTNTKNTKIVLSNVKKTNTVKKIKTGNIIKTRKSNIIN